MRTEAGRPLDPTPRGMAPKELAELLRIRGAEPGTSSQVAPKWSQGAARFLG